MGNGQDTSQSGRKGVNLWVFFGCLLVLATGFIGMTILSSMKQPPKEAETKEIPTKVDVLHIEPVDHQVRIIGYGQANALNSVSISSEVAGRAISLHPRAEVGETIDAGETLFQIDPTSYQAAFSEALAGVTQWENTVLRLNKQKALDQARLKTLKRNKTITFDEFQRLKQLFEKDQVGSRSAVDRTEQQYNQAVDQLDLLERSLDLYPVQIREAQSGLAAAQARLQLAQTRLNRCTVKAPFHCRIKEIDLEVGQYLNPGQVVMKLADDSVLEISVPLDSRDAYQWLRFDSKPQNKNGWFGSVVNTDCDIYWTEEQNHSSPWKGKLHRVVKYDSQTRTLTVAVRVANNGQKDLTGLPLVEGMFCRVEIPGKLLKAVFRLPRQAVTQSRDVYLMSAKNRLKTVKVEVVRSQNDVVFVGSGLKAGDKVVTTRLIDPLEGILLEPSENPEPRG